MEEIFEAANLKFKIKMHVLSQKYVCTHKKLSHNHEIQDKSSLAIDMIIIKILMPMKQG